MAMVGLIVTIFLLLEARRYRYFNIWRARARLLETDFFTPLLRGEGVAMNAAWTVGTCRRRPLSPVTWWCSRACCFIPAG